MVRKELADYVYPIFYQSSQAVHAIGVPLPPVLASFVPPVVPQPLPLISHKFSCVDITRVPTIASISVLSPLVKITFIRLLIVEYEFACSLLQIILPETLIDISIFIVVNSLESEVISEGAPEDISIKQPKFSFYF